MSRAYAAGVVKDGLLSLWDEPAVPDPPRRVWRDWVVVAVLLVAVVLEGTLRPDVAWRPLAIVLALGVTVSLLWRRTHPLAVVVGVMTAVTVLDVLSLTTTDGTEFGLISMVGILLLPYALARWASGRDIVIGLAVVLGGHILRELVHQNLGDLLIGIGFLLAPALLGLAVRYQSSARSRQLDQFRLREREQLARELHDTVAHHVSAIAIQAQAGRVIAETRPEAAADALRTIEAEASRALSEMRTMVRTLRDGQAVDLVPQHGVADLALLADERGDAPRIVVDVSADVGTLRPAVDAAVYRLVQESITNAVRHARHATLVDVRITADADSVRVSVIDDGDEVPARAVWGYGLTGMTERATLLGGTLAAGPRADGGWSVTATVPRTGGVL